MKKEKIENGWYDQFCHEEDYHEEDDYLMEDNDVFKFFLEMSKITAFITLLLLIVTIFATLFFDTL